MGLAGTTNDHQVRFNIDDWNAAKEEMRQAMIERSKLRGMIPYSDLCKQVTLAPAAEPFTANVVRVKDGDTIVVLHDSKQIDIRLEGIDCPESGQAFGQKAKEATSALAHCKTVTVETTGTDRYERTLANVILPDGRSLNQELVRPGCACCVG